MGEKKLIFHYHIQGFIPVKVFSLFKKNTVSDEITIK